MITVVLTLGASDELVAIKASGHAGKGKLGSDPVCAAVSFLLRTIALYLDGACSVKAETRGAFSLSVNACDVVALQADLQVLARFAQRGLSSLIAENPSNVKLTVEQLTTL